MSHQNLIDDLINHAHQDQIQKLLVGRRYLNQRPKKVLLKELKMILWRFGGASKWNTRFK